MKKFTIIYSDNGCDGSDIRITGIECEAATSIHAALKASYRADLDMEDTYDAEEAESMDEMEADEWVQHNGVTILCVFKGHPEYVDHIYGNGTFSATA